ncbi:hybrid sensor histidine kinase/response regulator transcription factor [Algibacter lectus]|uniref:hybrid sensor histidine kinase/response regulator transcription factor n=1 Tax=Algibacter lectus TaxID=221126 RepID=UPI0024945286|nr:two-component regulator propeller domain-containing protein [Algibacter lectus]
MFKLKYFLLVFCINIACFSQINDYPFTHLSTTDGLSQSSAIAIEQDNLGQIWIGTRDGLNKYDGTKFTVYRTKDNISSSISNNDILCIKEDTNGFIWIGTYNGLNKYNPKTDTFTRYFHSTGETSLINNTIWVIEEFSNGSIGIGTSAGLSIYNNSTDSFKNYLNSSTKNDEFASHVLSIIETKNNSIYIGTTKGLIKNININTFNFQPVAKTEALYIQDIIETPQNNLLLATRTKSVLQYNPYSKIITPYFLEKTIKQPENNIRQLQYDTLGELWIGTYNGLQISDKNKNITLLKTDISDPNSLSKNSIKSIFKDKKGSIWIGTYYGGINIWDTSNNDFTNINQKPDGTGLSYNVVSSIENYNNHLFIGTEGGGINRLNLNNNIITYLNKKDRPEILNNNIKSLFLSKNNNLWIGTFNSGVAIYNPKLDTFNTTILSPKIKRHLKDVGIYTIKQDNTSIWLGTFGKGLIKYNITEKTFKSYVFEENSKQSLSSNLVRTIKIDSKKNIWVGTERGLNMITPKGNIDTFFYKENLKTGDDILSIFEDDTKNIWVGTKAKGLFKYSNYKFKSIPIIINGTIVSSIHSIIANQENELWLSTNQGLIKYNSNTNKSIIFNQKKGLINNEFNDNSSLKIGHSKFYFGGPSGITYFNTKQLEINNYAPQVIITDFKIKNKSVNLNDKTHILKQTIPFTKNLTLDYNQGNFSISFSIPNYINSNNNNYKYRLKGLQNDWIETMENNASYTIQNPGDYIFEVKGANSDGVWNTTPTELKIKVTPAPWKSWWAFILYSLLILSALYFLMSTLKSKTKLQTELKLEHLEVERTKETNKAKLEFFTNISHEFRTPLTLILGPLQQILNDYKGTSAMYKKLLVVESSANHLLHLINRLMDFRKLENKVFLLEAAEGNIVKFLKEIYLSFSEYAKDGGYNYSFHTTEDQILVYYDRYKLERVFYNLISNAFRYTPKNGTIEINISQENDNIIIDVIDSGVGIAPEYRDKIFERFFEVSTNKKPDNDYNQGTGIGLSIVKNIISLHKGDISVMDNKNNIGSIFSIKLPIGRTHLTDDEIITNFKFSDDVSQYTNQLNENAITIEDDITEQPSSGEKPTILLVEDHKPLRKFMKSILKNEYHILEAENGKTALKAAQTEKIDIIISDVVMPKMAGTELCKHIKKDIRTSHIPIILLTSRSALIYKLEGLESGADDYLSKPFDVNEFKLRIRNQLETRNRLKQKLTSSDTLIQNDVIVTSIDEKLYKKALQIIENNIGNEDFDIPFFCSELAVSRTMLFIKIKAWTNFTPNEFIQHFRMQRAAQLLEQGKLNISQVSYKVGFKNPKYFSKCFQKKFSETPTQYSNKFIDS